MEMDSTMTRKSKTEIISEREFGEFMKIVDSHLGFLVVEFGFQAVFSRNLQEYHAEYSNPPVTISVDAEQYDIGGIGISYRLPNERVAIERSLHGVLQLRALSQARMLTKLVLADKTTANINKRLSFEAACLRDFCPDLLHGRGDLIHCDSFAAVVDSMKDE